MDTACRGVLLALAAGAAVVWGKTSPEECGPAFRGKCLCGVDDYQDRLRQYIVNCSGTGFKDTSVLQHLPAQVQVLVFTGNSIPELPWNVFGTLNNLSELRVVDMSNNGIKDIKGKTYHRVANVERLVLNNNDLTISESGEAHHHHPRVFSNFVNLMELHLTDAFADNVTGDLAQDLHDIFVNSNLTKVKKLHLEQNEISVFKDPDIFCDLPGLMDLHLGDNLLPGIGFNLACLGRLRFLDLEGNRISGLSEGELAMLDSLPARNQSVVVDLGDNPLPCDCSVRRLYTWLQTTRVQVRNKDALRCRGGVVQCEPRSDASSSAGSHYVSNVILGLMFTTVVLLGAAAAFVYRAELNKFARPIKDSVSRKIQYTSIGKPEDQEMEVIKIRSDPTPVPV
ncbi:trophoblast glycoprotein [Bacillus rossius redtenbacheri]|uniref:trophoblast glycoprotein n=1 Tax=Bacillus rossius redtenbacheri TaxID=93214 RepID=UPI002FDD0488